MPAGRQAPSPVTRPAAGLLLIALAAASWGTTGSVMSILVARAEATPLVTGAVRMWVAAALLAVTAALIGRGRLPPGIAWRCGVMGLCMAGYQASYFTAVTLTGIVVTALIAICSAPIMIAVLAAVLLGERLTARTTLALALGVIGTALLVLTPGGLTPARSLVSGVVLALAAGLSYAVYVIAAKSALVRGAAPLTLTAATFTIAAVLLTPALAWAPALTRQLAAGWPWLLYLGAVATAGAYGLYALGLRTVPASRAGIVTLVEPLTATLLGVLLFGERLGAAGLGGAVLLAAALVVLAREPA